MGGSNRTLREERSFTEAVKNLGGAEKIDVALATIVNSLSSNPQGFPLVPDFEPIRLAKTRALRGHPVLKVWFKIEDDGVVSLLYIAKG